MGFYLVVGLPIVAAFLLLSPRFKGALMKPRLAAAGVLALGVVLYAVATFASADVYNVREETGLPIGRQLVPAWIVATTRIAEISLIISVVIAAFLLFVQLPRKRNEPDDPRAQLDRLADL